MKIDKSCYKLTKEEFESITFVEGFYVIPFKRLRRQEKVQCVEDCIKKNMSKIAIRKELNLTKYALNKLLQQIYNTDKIKEIKTIINPPTSSF